MRHARAAVFKSAEDSDAFVRDALRADFANAYLKGQGVEIGAGDVPHRLPAGVEVAYYDKRSEAELAKVFGNGQRPAPRPVASLHADFPGSCDFLIAHHVLEHCADPIGELISWHKATRDGGVVVLSLPDSNFCPDRGRRVATIDHLLLDHGLGRKETAFESKEHIYSFLLGWVDRLWLKGATQQRFARFVLDEADRDLGHDLH
jgi:SAM-dependent methyltransferase